MHDSVTLILLVNKKNGGGQTVKCPRSVCGRILDVGNSFLLTSEPLALGENNTGAKRSVNIDTYSSVGQERGRKSMLAVQCRTCQ